MKTLHSKSILHILTIASLPISLIFAMLTPSTNAHAAGLTVNSLLDTIAVDGACTLREAIQNANNDTSTNADCTAGSGSDTITFSVSGTILLGSQLPNITVGMLSMDGTGQTLTISGDDLYQVLLIDAGASLILDNLTIADGSAGTGNGGGINNSGTLSVSNSIFSGNNANYGGGIYSFEGTLIVTNSTFSGNSALYWGGGIYKNGGTATITDSTFSGNNATTVGGGISNYRGTLTVTNSTFSGNNAITGGGGIFDDLGTLTITNSTFSGNNVTGVTGSGGGIYAFLGTLTAITNSTFSGNSAATGGGISNASSTAVILRNTILANNTGGNCGGDTIFNGGNNIDDGATCGWGSAYGSMSSTDPLLGALADNGGPNQTFALLAGSPAIDGVTYSPPNSALATDQRGVARPQSVRYDIGAYETAQQFGPTFVVNSSDDTDVNLCERAPGGDCTLREAINAANAMAGANTITFSVSGTITLGTSLPTITDAAGLTMDGIGQTVTISGDDLYQVLFVDPGASLILDKLTIADGSAGTGYGGGINNSGTLSVSNSIFSGNNANYGGGIYSSDGTLIVTNSTFSGNSALYWGGGIYKNGGTATITGSTFSGNSATAVIDVGAVTGGGIYNYGGTATITNSTFSGNSSTKTGGGISSFYSTTSISNSTFSGNSATSFSGTGGGIYTWNDTLTITNSTFSGNSAPARGGTYNVFSTVTFRNTILANNTGDNCGGDTIINGGNNIDDGATCGWGSANGSMSSTDPLLGPLAENGGPNQTFALLAGSPAIDGVTYSPPNGAPSTDQRGVARPLGERYDIGAYESIQQPGPTFVVNVLADSDDTACEYAPAGDCTLREAINAANTLVGANILTFSVSGTITLGSSLPTITDAAGLTMDGSGQTVTISGDDLYQVLFIDTGASLILENLTIADGNAGSFQGGGISNQGTLTITNSTFSGNSAGSDLSGGAIFNYFGTLTVTNSTFSGNSADNGGAIFIKGVTAIITNSTFSGNSANQGGGIYILDGTVTIMNSTFSGNNATTGGGISNDGGIVTLLNTILANSASGGNCRGTITDSGYNIDDGTSCALDPKLGSMSSTDPLLDTLADNGGPTQTFALLAGSLAIDAGDDTACSDAPVKGIDQRGVARPQGERCDIGAYEYVDTTAPTVGAFTVTTPTNNLNIPITGFKATDDVAVTGYMITESDTIPLAGAAGWTSTAPASYTVSMDGSYTLYPWVKDATGNVSALFASPRPVVVDTIAPDTQINTHPTDPSNSANASFTFSSADGTATFECSLEGGDYETCTSPKEYTGLGDGEHTFAARATDAAGNVDDSPASHSWTILLPPPAPTGVSASDGTYTDKVRVSWTAASGATSYKVYRATSATGTKVYRGTFTGTTFDDTTPTPGITYTYWVVAYKSTSFSAYSTANTGWRKLLPPTSVLATDGTYTDKVRVSWVKSNGATSYKVYRATSATGAKVYRGLSTGAYFDDTTGTPGITYTYWVVAYRGASLSAYSTYNTGWRKLLPPTNVQASDGTYTDKVRVTWTASLGATSYKVYRAATATGTKALRGSTTGVYFDDTTATPGVTYYYWVVAYRGASLSAYSTYNTGWRR